MLHFAPVEIDYPLTRENPLFVGNFFSLKSMWWTKRKARQELILAIAAGWHRTVGKYQNGPGLIEVEIAMTAITKTTRDAHIILDKFFHIKRLGFNRREEGVKSFTIVSPRRLSNQLTEAVNAFVEDIRFYPGPAPLKKLGLTESLVTVQTHAESAIRNRLVDNDREDLLPAVNWLFKQEGPITFYYERSGKLQARDRSVWPIKNIEAWPGWLRTSLFGSVIDIENAYCQFLMQHLNEKFQSKPETTALLYPDLYRLDTDKTNYRIELCRDYLKLEPTESNISLVKRLIMSLANGSNATAALLRSPYSRSQAVSIVRQLNSELTVAEIERLGDKLSFIVKQFSAAKRVVCIRKLKKQPTRLNQKKIFGLYFQWEREARYKIWNATGKTGLHLHDGIDGVNIKDTGKFISDMFKDFNLKVSIEQSPYNLLG